MLENELLNHGDCTGPVCFWALVLFLFARTFPSIWQNVGTQTLRWLWKGYFEVMFPVLDSKQFYLNEYKGKLVLVWTGISKNSVWSITMYSHLPSFICSAWAFRWEVGHLCQQSIWEYQLRMCGGVLFLAVSHLLSGPVQLCHCKLTLLLIMSSVNVVQFCIWLKTFSKTAVSPV